MSDTFYFLESLKVNKFKKMKEAIGSAVKQPDKLEQESPVEEKKVSRNINEYLKQHGIEAPPVSVHIFFSGHGHPKDLEGFDEALEGVDIFIPEMSGWDRDILVILKKVSSGEMSPEEVLEMIPVVQENPFFETLFKKLYKSNKKITIVDVPSDSILNHEASEADGNLAYFFSSLFERGLTFEQAINELKILLKKSNDVVVSNREEYILKQFGPKIEEVLGDNPELLKRDKIKALMLFGVGHNEFFHQMKKDNPNTSREFAHSPFVFSHSSEIQKRVKHGKPVSRHLYAKALIETMVLGLPLFDDIDKVVDLNVTMRNIGESFTTQEVEDVFNYLSGNTETEDEYMSEEEYLMEVLKRKGLLPTVKK